MFSAMKGAKFGESKQRAVEGVSLGGVVERTVVSELLRMFKTAPTGVNKKRLEENTALITRHQKKGRYF
jgi:hypothetical protein